jgi:hypothetical protein
MTPSPIISVNKSTEAFKERILSRIYFLFIYALKEVRSEARNLDQEQAP